MKATVPVVINDLKMIMQSQLTHPRIKPKDYIFHGKSPFDPPEETPYISVLHTGHAYIEMYNDLIEFLDHQVLLHILVYIDESATGHFAVLPINAVKISLGIFTQKARDRPYMWKILGYITKITKAVDRGN